MFCFVQINFSLPNFVFEYNFEILFIYDFTIKFVRKYAMRSCL